MFAPLRTLSFRNRRPSAFPLFQFLFATPPLRPISSTRPSIHIPNSITIRAFQLNRTLAISFFFFFLSFENPQTHSASSSHLSKSSRPVLLKPPCEPSPPPKTNPHISESPICAKIHFAKPQIHIRPLSPDSHSQFRKPPKANLQICEFSIFHPFPPFHHTIHIRLTKLSNHTSFSF